MSSKDALIFMKSLDKLVQLALVLMIFVRRDITVLLRV